MTVRVDNLTTDERRQVSLSRGRKPRAKYWTAKTAAKHLGVGIELVEGLVGNKSLAGYVDVSPKGNPIFMVEINNFFREAAGAFAASQMPEQPAYDWTGVAEEEDVD